MVPIMRKLNGATMTQTNVVLTYAEAQILMELAGVANQILWKLRATPGAASDPTVQRLADALANYEG